MTTTADAIEVMTIVAACHHRTAPRMDDREAIIATASVWAELFSAHRLELSDLLAAVKMRAQFERDAPEPAEIIKFARKVRTDRAGEEGPTPEYEALCESKAEDADELAERRRDRALAPKVERPQLRALVAGIAKVRAIDTGTDQGAVNS